ncbi:MAG TPA: LuxR C-terminal-related transcriptional regulator [Polyangia bacterium]|jgi:DNA-binding CsgD family transcriptional regulator
MVASLLLEDWDVGRGDASLTELIWRGILDALELGVVLCDAELARVRYANLDGTRALAALGGLRGRVPAAVRAALGAGPLPAPRQGGFTRAVRVTLPRGPHYFVRVRPLRGAVDGVLMVLSRACLRDQDRVELLHRRLGLSRRQSQCVALLRDGLRNQDIGARLALTEDTVKQYLRVIYETLGVARRSQLVALVDETLLRAEPGEAPGPWADPAGDDEA